MDILKVSLPGPLFIFKKTVDVLILWALFSEFSIHAKVFFNLVKP